MRGLAVVAAALGLGNCASSPAVAGPSNRQLVEVTDIDGLSVSPDGRTLAFRTVRADIERNSYDLEWYALDLGTGKLRSLAGGGDPIFIDPGLIASEAPIWIEAGKAIALRALIDGAIGVWEARIDGSGKTPLILRDEDVEDLSLDKAGNALVYKVGPSRGRVQRLERLEYDRGILVDSTVDLAQNLYRGGSINGRMASQRLVGYWYVRSGLTWREPRQEHRFDLGTRVDRVVGAPAAPGPFKPPEPGAAAEARSPRGDIATAEWNGTTGSLGARLADGGTRRCADPLCTTGRITALAWRPGSHDLLVTFTDRYHRQSLHLWNLDAGTLRAVASSEGLLSGGRRSGMPCALSARAVLCVAAGPASPPRLESIDLETLERRTLFDPNSEMRRTYDPVVRFLSWPMPDGGSATGILMTPRLPTATAAPLFVNYYSCQGFLRGGEGDEWPMPALLDAGFAIGCINLVPFQGPQDAVGTYRTGLAAVRGLISTLSSEHLIDPGKVAIGGLSFGSEVAMWTAIHSRLLAAVSIASTQIEPSEYWMSAMPGSDHSYFSRKVWGLGPPEQTAARWKLVSPALNAERVKAPILFQLPEQEARRIPELYSRLSAAGTPTELYAFPDEAHIKLQPRHRLAIYERNLDWFRYWLQGFKDDDPKKAVQYERWDRLRARQRARSPATIEAKAPARQAR